MYTVCCMRYILICMYYTVMGFPGGTSGKEPACQCRRHETRDRLLGWEDPLEEGMVNPLQYSCLENPMNREA